MAEKCLMTASLAILVFHRNSTIRCFKPRSDSSSPQRENPISTSKPSHGDEKSEPSKARKKLDFHAHSITNKLSPPLPPKMELGTLSNVVTDLVEGEPSIGVAKTIFQLGWDREVGHTIENVLKVNHNKTTLNRYEAYRKLVKSNAKDSNTQQRIERLVVDGNELLRFYGAVITCSLGLDGVSRVCNKKSCGVCKVLKCSVLAKGHPVSFSANSWKAHEKGTTRCFIKGFSGRKSVIICRVIAGRVACSGKGGRMEGEEAGCDSVVGSTVCQSYGSEGLVVLNPCAILPCFVVIYSIPK